MNIATYVRRALLGAGLALAALAPAAFGGPVADAQPAPPTLSPLRVQAFGTEATVAFTSSEPVAVTITHQPTGGGQPTTQAWDIYTTTHETTLTGLASNTQYQVSVTAMTRDGRRTNGAANFYTAKKRVRVTLREINITRDGDAWWSNGEPAWLVRLQWAGGEVAGCFPNNGNVCEVGSYGEGRFVPRNYLGQPLTWIFAEENFDAMPAALGISADAKEFDFVPIVGGVLDFLERGPSFETPGSSSGVDEEWHVPAGQDFASTAIVLSAGNEEFKSTTAFTFELFHDNLSYPAARNSPLSTWTR
jgi:hypothetical protein